MRPIQTTSHKFFGLDHLRALAIILVWLYHYSGIFSHPKWMESVFSFGWTGVDLFFVLSGFLISSQLFAKIAHEQKIVFKTFFIKRFFRIIPAYLVIVAIYFCFPFTHENGDTAPVWKLLTFTQNLGLDRRTSASFSHAWSLCIEEQFYLVLPLLLIFLIHFRQVKKAWILLPILFVTGFAARLYAWHYLTTIPTGDNGRIEWMKWIYYPTYARLDGLLAGVSIAALFQFKPIIKQQLSAHGNKLLMIGVAALIACWFLCADQTSFATSIFGFPAIAISYALVVTSAILPTGLLYKFRSRITATISTLSYVLYLSHKIVIHLTQNFLLKWNIQKESNVTVIICILNCLIIAYILNSLVEKPFFKVRDYLLRTKQPIKPARMAV